MRGKECLFTNPGLSIVAGPVFPVVSGQLEARQRLADGGFERLVLFSGRNIRGSGRCLDVDRLRGRTWA